MSDLIPEPLEDFVETFLPEVEQAEADEEFADLERELEEFPESDDLIVVEEEKPPPGRSWAFDFRQGTFFPGIGRSHGPLETRGLQTLQGWIEKCLNTDRGAHTIHPPDYGMERPFDTIGRSQREAMASDYAQRVRDALTFHPRIVDVTDFSAEVAPDSDWLLANFHVVLDDETLVPVATTIPL
jgi:hypothetical protein